MGYDQQLWLLVSSKTWLLVNDEIYPDMYFLMVELATLQDGSLRVKSHWVMQNFESGTSANSICLSFFLSFEYGKSELCVS